MTPEERTKALIKVFHDPKLTIGFWMEVQKAVSDARLEALEEAAKIAENFAMTEVMQREWLASAVIADKIRKAKAK